jgi:phage terminase Nu1 subunit (DNA packaging protein)
MSRQDQALQTLMRARQQLAEIETVGVETVAELQRQKKVVIDVRGGVAEIQSELDHSNKLLNKMRNAWNQLFK